jgi:GrpB-like predicted nucleotidyltransferase (UPF0157 family)
LIKSLLLEKLMEIPLTIEHVGSTAVPGLRAKPIIDVDLAYKNSKDFARIKKRLEQIGYYHNGDQGIPGREAFIRPDKSSTDTLDTIPHHLYVCREDNAEFRRHISFRNYLSKNEWARSEYQDLKMKIARKAAQNHSKYAELKEIEARTFVERVLQGCEE